MLNEWSGFSVRLQTANSDFVFHAQRHRHSPCLSQIFAQVTTHEVDVVFSHLHAFRQFFLHIIRNMQNFFKLIAVRTEEREKLQHLRRASYRFFQGSVLFTIFILRRRCAKR